MKNKKSHPEKKAIWWKESWPHSSSSTTSNKGLLTAKGYQQYRVWGYHENAFSQTISYLSFFPLHSPGFGICHNMEERTVVRELVVGSLPIYMCLGWRKEAKPIALRLATSGGRWESTRASLERTGLGIEIPRQKTHCTPSSQSNLLSNRNILHPDNLYFTHLLFL